MSHNHLRDWAELLGEPTTKANTSIMNWKPRQKEVEQLKSQN